MRPQTRHTRRVMSQQLAGRLRQAVTARRRNTVYRMLVKRHHQGKCPCYVCGEHVPRLDATLEHIQPRSRGGSDNMSNLSISRTRRATRPAATRWKETPPMSRSGYLDDYIDYQWAHLRWRGAVASSIRGKRGQLLLRQLVDALDAMPVKRLIADELVAGGEVCALGAVGQIRQLDMTDVDPEDCQVVARLFDIAESLAREIVYQNDEAGSHLRDETPEHRWARVRAWAASQLLPTADGQG